LRLEEKDGNLSGRGDLNLDHLLQKLRTLSDEFAQRPAAKAN
jgi:hypothetical protein